MEVGTHLMDAETSWYDHWRGWPPVGGVLHSAVKGLEIPSPVVQLSTDEESFLFQLSWNSNENVTRVTIATTYGPPSRGAVWPNHL